jgi:long-subunit acyl-CoA synthetase (AMP-forming)
MVGYYQQQLGNEKAFTADGFMWTGDVGMGTSEATRASATERRT